MIEEVAAAGDASAVAAIAESIKDEEPEVRAAAAKALGVFHDEGAISPLIEAIKDRKPEVRSAAIVSLRQIGDSAAIDALVHALKDYHHAVRWRRRRVRLNALGWRPSNNFEFILRAVASGQHEEAAVHGAEAVEMLANALSDQTAPRRHAAAAALGKTADVRAVRPLETALSDEDSHVRVAAVEALSVLGHAQSSNALLNLLNDPDHLVRAATIEALGRMGDPRIVEHIGNSLIRDPSWDVRKLAVERAGPHQGRSSDPTALAGVEGFRQRCAPNRRHRPGPDSRPALDRTAGAGIEGREQLGATGGQGVVAPDRPAMGDFPWGVERGVGTGGGAERSRSYWVAQSAADTLAKINDMRQRSLETSFFTNPAKEKMRAALAILVDSVRTSTGISGRSTVEALGRMGDMNAVAPLVSALDDPDEWVGRAAALALNHLNREPAADDTRRAETHRTLMLRI